MGATLEFIYDRFATNALQGFIEMIHAVHNSARRNPLNSSTITRTSARRWKGQFICLTKKDEYFIRPSKHAEILTESITIVCLQQFWRRSWKWYVWNYVTMIGAQLWLIVLVFLCTTSVISAASIVSAWYRMPHKGVTNCTVSSYVSQRETQTVNYFIRPSADVGFFTGARSQSLVYSSFANAQKITPFELRLRWLTRSVIDCRCLSFCDMWARVSNSLIESGYYVV